MGGFPSLRRDEDRSAVGGAIDAGHLSHGEACAADVGPNVCEHGVEEGALVRSGLGVGEPVESLKRPRGVGAVLDLRLVRSRQGVGRSDADAVLAEGHRAVGYCGRCVRNGEASGQDHVLVGIDRCASVVEQGHTVRGVVHDVTQGAAAEVAAIAHGEEAEVLLIAHRGQVEAESQRALAAFGPVMARS